MRTEPNCVEHWLHHSTNFIKYERLCLLASFDRQNSTNTHISIFQHGDPVIFNEYCFDASGSYEFIDFKITFTFKFVALRISPPSPHTNTHTYTRTHLTSKAYNWITFKPWMESLSSHNAIKAFNSNMLNNRNRMNHHQPDSVCIIYST